MREKISKLFIMILHLTLILSRPLIISHQLVISGSLYLLEISSTLKPWETIIKQRSLRLTCHKTQLEVNQAIMEALKLGLTRTIIYRQQLQPPTMQINDRRQSCHRRSTKTSSERNFYTTKKSIMFSISCRSLRYKRGLTNLGHNKTARLV